MQITDVKVFPVNEPKLKAYITIILDGIFVVRDIKVIQGLDLFVCMPNKKTKSGEFKDVAHPLNQKTRDAFSRTIIDSYLKKVQPHI